MKPKSRKLLVGCATLVGGFVLLFAALTGYLIWKSGVARKNARALCAKFPEGSNALGFEKEAAKLGLDTVPPMPASNATHPGTLAHSAFDSALMARHFCTIEVREGIVVSAKTSFLD